MIGSSGSMEVDDARAAGAALILAEICRRGEPTWAAEIMRDYGLTLKDLAHAEPEDLAELKRHEEVRAL